MKHFIAGLTKFIVSTVLVVSLVACGGAEERKVKYLEKGKAYLEEKNYDKAKIEFKNVLQIDPKFAEAYFYMGQIEIANKEYGRALGLYRKAVDLDPNHINAKVKLSKIYVIAGTTDLVEKAKVLLADVKKQQPDNAEAKLILATLDYKLGKKEKAIASLEKIVVKNKHLVEGISLLSTLYNDSKESDKAINLLKKGVKDNPQNTQLHIVLSKLLKDSKDYSGAEYYLKKAVSIEPENYSLQMALSLWYSSSNQYDKAESTLRNTIEQDQDDAKRYLMLVEFLSSRVSVSRGEEELEKAISRKPDLYPLKFAQVKFYEKTGKTDELKKVLKQIIIDKNYEKEGVEARILMAKYLLGEGNKEGAKSYVDEVITEYPNNNDALLIVSKLSLMDSNAIEAINGLRSVLKNDPENVEASLLLSQAHIMNGEISLAENELVKSIELNPTNEMTHLNYATYMASKSRFEDAISIIDKALYNNKDSYKLLALKLKLSGIMKKSESEILSILDAMEHADSSNSQVNIIRGHYYITKKDMDLALDQFEKAYVKSISKYQPLELIVKLHLSNNKPDLALSRLKKITDVTPDDAIANYLTGQVYMAQKKILDGRSKFELAMKSAAKWDLPYSALASTYIVEKNYDAAIEVYKNAISKLNNIVPFQIKMATLYEQKKDFPAAMKIYQDILFKNSGNKLAANNYASLLLDYGTESDVAKALELAKEFEKSPQPALQDTLAWAYAKSGDSTKAIEILKPIVEKSPKIAVFRYHMGYALFEAGDKGAAKSHLEIAVSSEQKFPGKDKAAELLKSI